ncbi:translation initiation factor eIF-3b [Lactarius hatsudake]|nr:translation initiation factor eIF-3b [Lactarius hatsudake]
MSKSDSVAVDTALPPSPSLCLWYGSSRRRLRSHPSHRWHSYRRRLDKSKLEKLLAKITKYAFIQFRNANAATYALNKLNGHPFNAKRTFLVNRFTDIKKFADLDEMYVGTTEHLQAWLANPQGRDQYVTYREDEVSIHWHGRPSQCEVAFEDNRRTSPRAYALFLPRLGNNIAIWDIKTLIKTGHLLRTFPSLLPEGEGAKKQMAWPALKWSPDDRYTARLTPGQQISVYELPSMGLQGKKSLKIEGVVDFEWCPHGEKEREDAAKASKKPTENMLAYWTPEVANQPARVTLLNFPGRTVLRQKNLFDVSEAIFCVRVDRHTDTKKSIFCNLEIFRVREKDFPVEVVELKDTVTDFSWEPKGERFAIVSSGDPHLGNPGSGVTIKTDARSWAVRRRPSGGPRADGTSCPRLSARRRNRGLTLLLEFWDLDFNSDDVQLGVADHYDVTDVEWDPSGRYLATAASAWTHTIENGYAIWDFRGQEIEKWLLDRFKQFLWRPRAPSLLTREQKRTIRRNLKEYARAFDEADAAEETSVSAELVAQRKRAVDEWNAWRVRVAEDIAEVRPEREPHGGAAATRKEQVEEEEDKEEIEVWIDEVIEQFEEVVE